jgi:Myb-like DNA-binding domain
MKPKRRLWTSDEDAALTKEVMACKSLNEIAKKIGRTPSAVQNRVYQLGLTLKRRRTKPTTIGPA